MKSYKTKSGSVYDVDGLRLRQTVRGGASQTKRASANWRTVQSVSCAGVGHPLIIVWGTGKDEHSDSPSTLQVGTGPDSDRSRQTHTSPVVEISDVQ